MKKIMELKEMRKMGLMIIIRMMGKRMSRQTNISNSNMNKTNKITSRYSNNNSPNNNNNNKCSAPLTTLESSSPTNPNNNLPSTVKISPQKSNNPPFLKNITISSTLTTRCKMRR